MGSVSGIKKQWQRALCALCVLLLISGCGARRGEVPGLEITEAPGLPASADTPQEDTELGEISIVEDPMEETAPADGWGTRRYHAVYTAASGQRCFETRMTIPYTDRAGAAYDAINAFFEAEVRFQRENSTVLVKLNVTPDMLGGSAEGCYTDIAWTPLWENGWLVSFSCSQTGWAGGAHGWENGTFAVFDLSDGVRLNLPDLFADGAQGSAAVKNEVLRQVRAAENASRERARSAETLLDDAVFLQNSFCLNRKGVVIRFNEYDIDCYAAGASEYTVPYGLLSAYLKPAFLNN